MCAFACLLVILLGFGGELPRCELAFRIVQTSLRFARSCAPSHRMQAPPRLHFVHHSTFSIILCLRGGWGSRPSLGRCSAVAPCCSPSLVHSLLCSSRVQRRRSAGSRNRTQLKLLCMCNPVRSALVHGCLGGTQNARSRESRLARAAAAIAPRASRALLHLIVAHSASCFGSTARAAY
jgi:hypothetical protein